MSNEYILVTPAKNEVANLPETIESISKQIQKPLLWLIVDDGSTDGTDKIIEQASNKYPWISISRLPNSKRDIGFHYSFVCKEGFSIILKLTSTRDIKFEYIALLDADMMPEPNYFKYLIEKMENNQKIGICSGGTWSLKDGKKYQEKQRNNLPSGGARIWKMKCFMETGGYELTMAPDSVSNARANLRGWETVRFENIYATQSRPVSSAEGVWIGYKKKGEFAHYLNFHLIHAFGKSLKFILSGEIKPGLAFGIGYFKSYINKTPKLKDKELFDYFKNRDFKTFMGGL